MNEFQRLMAVEAAVKREMAKQDKAHDWFHIDRVRKMALKLQAIEGGDPHLIEMVALVHDVGDRKAHESEEAGRKATHSLLEKCGVGPRFASVVVDIAHRISFKGFHVPDDMPSLEGKIVQDADRLDAVGAIAIARTFTWGGAHDRPMYDPNMPPTPAKTAEEYYASGGATSVNHFHEKLLHLTDRMHTKTARALASERTEFMREYLERFMSEWNLSEDWEARVRLELHERSEDRRSYFDAKRKYIEEARAFINKGHKS
ncbi:MAG: metal dependent phosphohydrolase [Candidatus Adlerbacteria bacterium]|nr:metal dependent phosphohydrolase [Candidatus Adlerbacteria bacterium]